MVKRKIRRKRKFGMALDVPDVEEGYQPEIYDVSDDEEDQYRQQNLKEMEYNGEIKILGGMY